MTTIVPDVRRRSCNEAPVRPDRRYVLYWMVGTRRLNHNFALDLAVEAADESNKPLLILEGLRCDYRWASARIHSFVIGGMRDNGRALKDSPVGYYPYVEPSLGEGKGLLERLAADACVVITDHQPGFFQPKMVQTVAERLDVRMIAVDSCGLLPLAGADRVFSTAHAFRRFLQRSLTDHLEAMPSPKPIGRRRLVAFEGLPDDVLARWPQASPALLAGDPSALQRLPIDHRVAPVATPGGAEAGQRQLERFVDQGLALYQEQRNHPDDEGGSGLSPYLHFGHVGTHQVLAAVARQLDWTPADAGGDAKGAREGWWGMPSEVEGFMDELVTWRELGYNFADKRPDYDAFASLPRWARATLGDHERDPRPEIYDLEQLEEGRTGDELWNAAQNELRSDGRMHNYLRMLWGKKILEWSPTPQVALQRMIELNNKWSLDGRDPNSYSGIFWVLGRYDRAWGPERPIFGKIRYMSSDNTRRKLRVKQYLRRYRAPAG